MKTLRLTKTNDRKVVLVLDNITHFEETQSEFGDAVTEVHFTNQKSLRISESFQEVEAKLADY